MLGLGLGSVNRDTATTVRAIYGTTVGGGLASCCTGDPDTDCGLIWWRPEREQWEILTWIIQLSGRSEARPALIRAARASGVVEDELADYLISEPPRPRWATGGAPWRVDAVIDAGEVQLPTGDLCAGDPYTFKAPPFIVTLAPGTFRVRIITAVNPAAPAECAATEVIVDEHAPVVSWSLVQTETGIGYTPDVGTGSFGSPDALSSGRIHDLCDRGAFGYHRSWRQFDCGELGSLVAFTVGPQHQICRTWTGHDSAGRTTRVLTDLGLLNIDPTADAHLTW